MKRIKITRRKKYKYPTKLTRATKEIIYEAIRNRLPLTRVVELSGASYSTFKKWMLKGRDGDNPIYIRFRNKVKKLLSEREREALDIIRACAKGEDEVRIVEKRITRGPKGREISILKKKQPSSWQAAARYLELVARETYGGGGKDYPIHDEDEVPGKVSIDLSGSIESKQNISMANALKDLGEEEIEQLASILRKVDNSKKT